MTYSRKTDIFVDAVLYRKERGGVEKAIEGIARGLPQCGARWGIHLFASSDLCRALADLPRPSNVKVSRVPYGSRLERIVREQALAWRHRNARLWHFLGYVMPFHPPRGALVATVYDIIALTHPHLCSRANRRFYGLMLPRTIRRADRILVPSRYVRERILERYPEAAPRIRVLPLPLPDAVSRARGEPDAAPLDSSGKRHLLFVGNLSPKKNVEFLLDAYARLPRDLRERHELRISGRENGMRPRYQRLADRLGIAARVRFVGYTPDGQMGSLYRSAAALLFPSLEEGYGYPPLEAMALGTPAVVSDRGALPEVAGGAGAVVSPLNPDEFAAETARLLSDGEHYRRVREKGRAFVVRDNWIDYARKVADIYGELIA